MLAEAVPIDFGSLLLVLLIAALGLAVSIVVVVFGFVLAPRAGRGSRRALGWWIAILALEAVACLGSLVVLLSGHFGGVFIAPAIVAAQVTIFVRARRAPH